MSLISDFLDRIAKTATGHAGDEALMQAAVSAAANVIVADGQVENEELSTALTGALTSSIVERDYDLQMLQEALSEAISRARSGFGRADNLRRVEAILDRPLEQREYVFQVAAEVADHDDITEIEHVALSEIATALSLDKARLLTLAPVSKDGVD
ncbi:tellurite resistance TerB family protein [Methylobacterium aerolatum]|uniref:Tellurite resistance protein n=1 Tax=Methylobacterium aerolatum TaxID=418708 RepID=A0ABU0I2J3_9HYPH|nr:tellurite resistance TerB family protein [Methylobacterium aerolatum]MDQ0448820.1 tellurite resistance protein [Methylobacterium aerolatum]GJD34089.1 hypothetical protein FMGBMHLM_0985 [Methylobacterium aerolatum]